MTYVSALYDLSYAPVLQYEVSLRYFLKVWRHGLEKLCNSILARLHNPDLGTWAGATTFGSRPRCTSSLHGPFLSLESAREQNEDGKPGTRPEPWLSRYWTVALRAFEHRLRRRNLWTKMASS
jgi:hypothetical protein